MGVEGSIILSLLKLKFYEIDDEMIRDMKCGPFRAQFLHNQLVTLHQVPAASTWQARIDN